jgi:predicted transcriptional regulator
MSAEKFYFDVHGVGPTVFLGPSEARLMELAWTQPSVTVKSALFHLGETSGTAYTTVSTLLTRLAEKGLLSRHKEGRNFSYRAVVGREEFLHTRVAAVRDCLRRNFSTPTGSDA